MISDEAKSFQVSLEGAFFLLALEETDISVGFFSSYVSNTVDETAAIGDAKLQLLEALAQNGVRIVKGGSWKSFCFVLDIECVKNETRALSGFSFFRIGIVDRLKTRLRLQYLLFRAPHRVIQFT
jgi:hypothetical protein